MFHTVIIFPRKTPVNPTSFFMLRIAFPMVWMRWIWPCKQLQERSVPESGSREHDIVGQGYDTLWLCQNSYGKWRFIVDLPIKHGGSFHSYVSLPEGICMIRWIEEILHQLKTAVYPIIFCVSTQPFGGAGFRNHPQYVRCYMLLSTHFSGGLSHFVSSFQMIFSGGIPFTRWISIDFSQISIENSWR